MMLHRFAELWAAGPNNLIAVSTNSAITPTGDLVMITGSARQAREIYCDLPRLAVKKIKEAAPGIVLDGTQDYGFLEVLPPPLGIGIFQTRRHWRDAPVIETIQRSTEMLAEYAAAHPKVQIRMTFPGYARRGRAVDKDQVFEILSRLPDNVDVIQWR